MSVLTDRLLEIHDALSRSRLPHAFGGAIALAYCTEEPRGTRDVDVNVFVDPERAAEALSALPKAVVVTDADIKAAEREGQVRVWWDDTPIDVFLDIHRFHQEVQDGVRWKPFAGRDIPVLGCTALVVFKVLFNRTKDWADIEEIVEMGAVDGPEAVAWVTRLLDGDDPVVDRLATLVAV
jgi:hypothetical protein